MRIILTLFVFLITLASKGQCYELLNKRLENIGDIPYVMVENFVLDVKTGQTIGVKIRNVAYKTKLGFIFDSYELGDTLDIGLYTLNRKLLTSKKITKDDYFLRYDPFRKSENYFLIIKTPLRLDSTKRPIVGCVGISVVERVKRKAFKKLQKIEWGVE